MFSGHNLWVVKPNDFNRGRGVHIFKTLEQLKKLILEYTNRTEANPNQNGGQLFRTEPENQNEDGHERKAQSGMKTDIFVIQKYIEQPLLIRDRKFDIRLWVLVTHEHKCFLFKEGYIRMSSYKYTLEAEMM